MPFVVDMGREPTRISSVRRRCSARRTVAAAWKKAEFAKSYKYQPEARASAPLGSWLPSECASCAAACWSYPHHQFTRLIDSGKSSDDENFHYHLTLVTSSPRCPPPPSRPKRRPPSGSCQSPPRACPLVLVVVMILEQLAALKLRAKMSLSSAPSSTPMRPNSSCGNSATRPRSSSWSSSSSWSARTPPAAVSLSMVTRRPRRRREP